jgi:hypothetical protein
MVGLALFSLVSNLAIMGLVMHTIVFFMAPQDGAVHSKSTHQNSPCIAYIGFPISIFVCLTLFLSLFIAKFDYLTLDVGSFRKQVVKQPCAGLISNNYINLII